MYFGFENIHVAYGDKMVLKGVSAAFEQGSITTIVGPNGCGKSSLLRILSRGVRPQRGTARFEGRDIREIGRREIAKRIAVLPQVHTAPADVDVHTLVSYGRYPHIKPGRRPTRQDTDRVEEVMAATGITHLADRPVRTLSGGERQRAWIAMTVCQDPEVLVLDEPTTYLDICHQMDILELIRRLNTERGITVVMVLHDLNLAARYSHALCAIRDGVVFKQGPPGEVVTAPLLQQVFGVAAQVYEDTVNRCPYFIPQKVL